MYPEYRDDGLEILAVVYEDDAAQPASVEYAREEMTGAAWPWAADPLADILLYYDRAATPLNMFVDTETMTITEIEVGWNETAVRNIIEGHLGL
jgi:hypothetical protein